MENRNFKADPSACLLFLFATACILTFCLYSGILGEEAALMCDIVMAVSFPIYILGGNVLLKNGEIYMANLWWIFGSIFGGIMGLGNIVVYAFELIGIRLDPSVYAIPLIIVSIVRLITMIPFRYAPAVPFCVWSMACIWCFTSGLEYIFGSSALYYVNMILSAAVGFGAVYLTCHELLRAMGEKGLPQGKPIFQQ